MQFITLPGIGGSGDRHWQTLWERNEDAFNRITVKDWDRPNLQEWFYAVETAVSDSAERPILVAHSLSCLLVAEYVARTPSKVLGAFLVAPPDPASKPFPKQAASEFVSLGRLPLERPSLVLASTNDPYGTLDYARRRASNWRGEIVELGACGHLNDLGEWPEGRRLLTAFAAGLR
jgi:predicted alpha/beta hydrolase family esterase